MPERPDFVPLPDFMQDSLRELPSMPEEQYAEGWQREGVIFPTFKEYLWTGREKEHYDIFLDVRVKGEIRSYWGWYGMLEDFDMEKEAIAESILETISEQLEESEPGLSEEMEVLYYWRSRKSEEEVSQRVYESAEHKG